MGCWLGEGVFLGRGGEGGDGEGGEPGEGFMMEWIQIQ